MRYMFLRIAELTIVFLLCGCGQGSNPRATVQEYLDSKVMEIQSREKVLAAFTKSSRETLAFLLGYKETLLSYEIKSETMRGSHAEVSAHSVLQVGNEKTSEEVVFVLKKEDGVWRIFKVGGKENQLDLEIPGLVTRTESSVAQMSNDLTRTMKKVFAGLEPKSLEKPSFVQIDESIESAFARMKKEMFAGAPKNLELPSLGPK